MCVLWDLPLLRFKEHIHQLIKLEIFSIGPQYLHSEFHMVLITEELLYIFFLIRIVGVKSNWVHSARWPIVPAPGDYEDGEFGGMKIGRGTRSTWRKPAPAPLCPPQIPHDLTGSEPGPSRWEASD
jgi:hypothetical protein